MSGKVYKIYSHKGDKVYIGSTTDRYLCNRFSDHRTDYRAGKRCTSCVLFDEYGMENCNIELIEEVEYKDVLELKEREQYWIDNTLNTVNIKPAYQTIEQKQEKKHVKSMKYFNNHKETILAKRRNLPKTMCECGVEIRSDLMDKHYESKNHKVAMGLMEDWRVSEEHKKELRKVRDAKYLEKNKEKISKKASLKIVCDCGTEISKSSLLRHKKSANHIKWIESLPQLN
jgi:hypothetical protein